MTDPEQPPHFVGFAGRGVPTPSREVLEVDPAAGLYGETADFFRGVGQEHATTVMNDLLRQWREPDFHLPYDFAATVTNFQPRAEYSLGGEYDDNEEDYVAGFVFELAEEADRMRSALNARQRGETYRPALYSQEQERLGDWTAGFTVRRGDLSDRIVIAAADQFDDLARTIAEITRVDVPYRLQALDERRRQETQDRAALTELTVAIDRYSVHRAAPNLVSTVPGLTGDRARAVERERLAARIAVLDTRSPHLLAGLSADRAQVLHYLLPESATRQHTGREPVPLTTTPLATDEHTEALFSAVNWTWTSVVAQGADTVTPADLAYTSEYLDTVADTVRRDPTLADHLPTILAGLARHLAEHHIPPADATLRAPAGPQTTTPEASADAAPATASPPPQRTTSTPSASSRHQLPGTAGTRHTPTAHRPGNGRTR